MADLTKQLISEAGLNPSLVAADVGGDAYINDDRTFFVMDNGDASPHTLTIAVNKPTVDIPGYGKVTFAAIAVVVPAGEQRWVKAPIVPYTDGNGKVQVTYDAVASVTVGAVKMPGG